MNQEEVFLLEHEIRQMGKTQMCIAKWKNMAMQAADPVAADRAKRYIWSSIERNQANSGRAEG